MFENEKIKQLNELKTSIKAQTFEGPYLLKISDTNKEAKDKPK